MSSGDACSVPGLGAETFRDCEQQPCIAENPWSGYANVRECAQLSQCPWLEQFRAALHLSEDHRPHMQVPRYEIWAAA
jgi:hypothetical protein